MSNRKVKMTESITGEDVLDVEYVDLVRDDLVSRFADTYPTAERVSISVSSGLDDDGVTFAVEGIIK